MAVVAKDLAREARALEVESALASVRLEGLEPAEEVKALFRRYVDGELGAEEFDCAMKDHLDGTYGSVRLSGHDRT